MPKVQQDVLVLRLTTLHEKCKRQEDMQVQQQSQQEKLNGFENNRQAQIKTTRAREGRNFLLSVTGRKDKFGNLTKLTQFRKMSKPL